MGPAPSFRCLVPRPQTSFRHLGTGPSHLGTLGPAQTVGLAVGMLRDDVQKKNFVDKRIVLGQDSAHSHSRFYAQRCSWRLARSACRMPHTHVYAHACTHAWIYTHVCTHCRIAGQRHGSVFSGDTLQPMGGAPSNQCSIESVFHRISVPSNCGLPDASGIDLRLLVNTVPTRTLQRCVARA